MLTAATVDRALALGKEYADGIQIPVTDVILPEMNGLQHFCPNMRRIFMSGYTSNAIAHHGVLDAGVHFIQKPFSKWELGSSVSRVLGEAND